MLVILSDFWHSVKVASGPQDPGPWDPGPPSKFKSGTWDHPQNLKGGPRDPLQSLKV